MENYDDEDNDGDRALAGAAWIGPFLWRCTRGALWREFDYCLMAMIMIMIMIMAIMTVI